METTWNILLVSTREDLVGRLSVLEESSPELASSFERVPGLDEAIRQLDETRFHACVVMDSDHPDGDLEVIRLLHERGCLPPILLLLEEDNLQVDLVALELGAADCLVLERLDGTLWAHAVRYAVARKKKFDEITLSEQRYAVAVTGARYAIWDWDVLSDRIYYSPQWASIFDLEGHFKDSPEDWLSQVYHADLDPLKAAIENHLEGRTSRIEHKFRMLNRKGETMWLRVRGHAIRDENDKAIRLAGTLNDITEGIKSSEALKESQDQLRQAQKMDAIGRLAGGVSHDFNNLLTAIIANSDMILYSLSDDHPVKSEVEEIRKAGTRAASLTRQLLAFSRKQVLQAKVVNINEVVSDIEKMLNRLLS
ncbi:MAG: PAS domain-containing protein, partial [Verrucomicrobiota bacterium]